MVTTLAQMVALVCHGNAAVAGDRIPLLFPGNSTMQFCASISFVAEGAVRDGKWEATTVADTPDQWIRVLLKTRAVGLRLTQQPRNQPGISDRMSAGFVGGGRSWQIEAVRSDSQSELWQSKWEVGNRQAPDRRIWNVTYGLCERVNTTPLVLRPLDIIAAALRDALSGIRAFSQRHDCGGFTECFAQALRALDEPGADIGYHTDLAPPGLLGPVATSLLKAAMVGWVFGGMGSWNDLGYGGDEREEYDRVSNSLFNLLNEAIEAAATSSFARS